MTSRAKVWSMTILLLLVALAAGLFDAPLSESFPGARIWNALPFKLGLDLQGGAHLVYQADVREIPAADRESAVAGTRDVIERRVNALGVSEPLVQTNQNARGDYRVIVELAGVFDVNEAIQQIGETPLLEFKELAELTPSLSTPRADNSPLYQGGGQEDGLGTVVGEVKIGEDAEVGERDEEPLPDPLLSKEREIRAEAQEVLARALAGEDFEALAREFSDDPTVAHNGGDLGFAAPGAFVPGFEEVAFAQNFADNEIWPELVMSDFGLHIIKKYDEDLIADQRQVDVGHILFSLDEDQGDRPVTDWVNTKLSGKHLKRASLVYDPNFGEPQVSLNFDSEGSGLFREITRRNIGRPVAIFLDGSPISVPVVQQEISGGQAVITGQFNVQEAKELADSLNAGALPVPIFLVSQQTVGPSLGEASVMVSLRAGLIGLLLVATFMLIYYRLPGLLAVVALAVYVSLVLLFFQLLNVTLTLAGIAGFILTIGMAVDANILIFERMKEELRRRKPLDEAINLGFARAWTSIRDANFSSLITAIILYWFGTSFIRGFAITFAIGVLLSMFSAVVVTKTFLKLVERFEARHLLFGVRPVMKADTVES